jgi:hypothetical protein
LDFFEIRNWFAHRFCHYLREGKKEELTIVKAVAEIISNENPPTLPPSIKKEILSTFPLIKEENGKLKLSEDIDPITKEYVKEKSERYLKFLKENEITPAGENVEQNVKLAIKLFNYELFFEVHELIEEIWMGNFGKDRDFLQALIQIGVAFYHRENFNERGYKLLLENALELLKDYSGMLYSINVDRLKEKISQAIKDTEYPHQNLFTP